MNSNDIHTRDTNENVAVMVFQKNMNEPINSEDLVHQTFGIKRKPSSYKLKDLVHLFNFARKQK